MRKKLWCCAAAAVVASVGVGFTTAWYACEHPDSWVGRCALAPYNLMATRLGTFRASAGAAELAYRGTHGFPATAAPLAVCQGAAAPQAEVVCAPAPAPDVVEVEMRPAVLPGAVVIAEDEAVRPAKPMKAVHDVIGVLSLQGALEESEPDEVPMPRAEDDAVKMPVCADAPPQAPMPGCPEECTPPAPSGRWWPFGAGHTTAPPTIKGKDVPAGNEDCEPAMQRLAPDGGEQPKHPDVDTMEVRPGDLMFRDFRFGPF